MVSTIAETQNMTKAAEKLFITQSALSQQLKHIESKLIGSLNYALYIPKALVKKKTAPQASVRIHH